MKQSFDEYVKQNGLRATARQFGKSTQWVKDRLHYKAILRKGKLSHIDGPPKSERCFPLFVIDQK